MVKLSQTSDFGFKIDFNRNTEDPARIFRALSKLIIFSETTDQTLIKALNLDIEYKLVLDNIQQGSIIVWLKILFDQEVNQDIIKCLSHYLGTVKQKIINFTNERKTINDSSELVYLQNEILKINQESKLHSENSLNIYLPPSEKNILDSIEKFSSAISELNDNDQIYYLLNPNSEPQAINHEFSLSSETKENLLTKDTLTSENEMILQIKKPDYLGESKWQFKHGKYTIEAKIHDVEWISLFRNGQIVIIPGDALKALVKIVTKYDVRGKVISQQHSVEKVIEVIPVSPNKQLDLFDKLK